MNALTKLATTALLSLGLAACTASTGDIDGQDPSNPNNPNNPDQAMTIAGDYQVKSDFNLTPADLGTGGDFALDLGELADDPVQGILSMLADELGINIPSFLEAAAADAIQDALGSDADVLSDTISRYLNASLNFKVVSNLEIEGSGRDLTMTHYPTGMEVTMGGETYEYDFADLKADTLQSYAIGVEQERNLTFSEHDLEIPYAQMLITVLDEVVIPSLDPQAGNLGDALNNIIDCNAIGQELDANITLPIADPDASGWASLCENGVDAAAAQLVSKIGDIDSLQFDVTLDGRATALDNNGDNRADAIEGSWNSKFFGAVENEIATPFRANRQ